MPQIIPRGLHGGAARHAVGGVGVAQPVRARCPKALRGRLIGFLQCDGTCPKKPFQLPIERRRPDARFRIVGVPRRSRPRRAFP